MKLRQVYDDLGEALLGQSAADLYELQRELQHVPGFPKGRPGPGGGAEATPEAVAVVIVALLAGGPRRRTRQRTPQMMALPVCSSGGASAGAPNRRAAEPCRLTSATTFGDAMREALSDSALAERIRQIIVCRDWGEAAIAWVDDDERLRESRFADAAGDLRSIEAERRGSLFSLARMGGGALAAIAQEIRRDAD